MRNKLTNNTLRQTIHCLATAISAGREVLCLTVVLAVFLLANGLKAQSGWSQSTACPGWNNPMNFVTGNGSNYYSGQTGQKASEIPNVLTGQTGINWTTLVYTAGQLGTVTHSSASHCGNNLPFGSNMFAIMSDTMQVAGSPVNRDPNTGDSLPFVPTQFNRYDSLNPIFSTNLTRSIRIGDNCGSLPSAAKLTYNMFVVPQNAMMYLYYACVFEAPNHNRADNPLFYIRVMKQNVAGVWTQVNDTLAYAVESTPVTNGGNVVPGQNGWHAYGQGNTAVYYKEWNKVSINLANYMYNDIRVEVMVSDCRAYFHYSYAYVAGECGPAMISANGCPDEQDTTVTTLMAPRSMVNYEWYASETGLLAAGTQTNPANSWRQLASGDSLENYAAKVGDFHITRRSDGSVCDSMGSQQTFRCRITSAIDPDKPYHTDFFIDVQNTKPIMSIDTTVIGDSVVRLRNRSHVPGNASLVLTDSTRWMFYGNSDGSGTPDTVVYGDSVDYPVPATPHSVRVRTVTTGDNCNTEGLYIIRPRKSAASASCQACPEVRIAEKYDHTPLPRHALLGWDTVADCNNRTLTLSNNTCLPVKYFNGYYTVEEIEYNPPDTTFYLGGQGIQIPVTSDDAFTPSSMALGFPFYFFGIRKEAFRVGDNGVITFVSDAGYAQDGGSNSCPYIYTAPLPWPPGTPGAPNTFNRMHDAIYGIYEDTYVGGGGIYISGNQGIYYGVVGEYPCRKIIASWNEVPLFGNIGKRESYQMVCYEGSNIIEVHVKKRGCCSATNGGRGTIGIQNATGLPQVRGALGTTTSMVTDGAPAAFWASNANPLTGTLDSVAYRFSPVGYATYSEAWYRLFDDGREAVALGTDATDTNGYFIPRGEDTMSDPNLSRAVVTPTTTTRYVYHLRFQNANNDWYDLYDTITVGVDTANALALHPAGDEASEVMTLCMGDSASMMLTVGAMQDTTQVSWSLHRTNNGTTTPLPASLLRTGAFAESGGVKRMAVSLNTINLASATGGGIDSVYLRCNITFANGCQNSDSLLLRIIPAASSDTTVTSCDHFVWHGTDYTTDGDHTLHLPGTGGCDSLVILHLTLRHSTDTVVSHYVVEDSLPHIWNGLSFATDTTGCIIHATNSQGCDSTINFNLTVYRNQDTTAMRTVCEGELPISWNGVVFSIDELDSIPGIITHQTTLVMANGADSVVTMLLSVLVASEATVSDTIVQNMLATYTPPLPVAVEYVQDETDPAMITIVDTMAALTNAAGCDSTVHYTLNVYRNYTTTDSVDICDDKLPYVYHGDTVTGSAGSVTTTATLTTANGADSVVTMTVNIRSTYEVTDTIVICPGMPFMYDSIDYGGPTSFDSHQMTAFGCDSLVHVTLRGRDSVPTLAPMASIDSMLWFGIDTLMLGCLPMKIWLRDTAATGNMEWALWSATDTAVATDSVAAFSLDTGLFSCRLIATSPDGCTDTVTSDSLLYVFASPSADFIWDPEHPGNHDPHVQLYNRSIPLDSCSFIWQIATTAGSGGGDTTSEQNPVYRWEPNTPHGDYPVMLTAYRTYMLHDSLSVTCTDTMVHEIGIVNTFLQFPNLVTPNGDGINDRWEIVNLVEMGQYSMNELWIYNQWGVLVFHAENIYRADQFWDPNTTNSPDGTYFFRFSGKGRYGVVKNNGTIEVLR